MIGIRLESTAILILCIPFLILLLSLIYFIHKRKDIQTNLSRYILFFILGLYLLPLGLLLPILWKNLRKLKSCFPIGLITSLSIEVLQLIENILFLGHRSVDIDDIIFNVFGIIIGYCLFKIIYNSKLDFLINKFQNSKNN